MLNELMYPKKDARERAQRREKHKARERGLRAPSACQRRNLITRQSNRNLRKELVVSRRSSLAPGTKTEIYVASPSEESGHAVM